MPASHSILVSASLIHLSPAEKRQAIQSLLVLGLSRYANNSGGSTSIDPARLQKLHGTFASLYPFCFFPHAGPSPLSPI